MSVQSYAVRVNVVVGVGTEQPHMLSAFKHDTSDWVHKWSILGLLLEHCLHSLALMCLVAAVV